MMAKDLSCPYCETIIFRTRIAGYRYWAIPPPWHESTAPNVRPLGGIYHQQWEAGYRPCCSIYCQERVAAWSKRWRKLPVERRKAEIVAAALSGRKGVQR